MGEDVRTGHSVTTRSSHHDALLLSFVVDPFCSCPRTHRLIYAAGTQGAFVSEDKAATWNALHVMISTTSNCTLGFPRCNHQVDRVQHDFQVRAFD